MSKSKLEKSLLRQMTENIVLLRALCEVPEPPKRNDLSRVHPGRHKLSIDRERQLSDDFAYLLKYTTDAHRVMAVGIEEQLHGSGLTVRLASNTGDLSFATQKLRGIASKLVEASRRDRSREVLRQELLRQIVDLDKCRILERLRSRHAEKTRKTDGKQPLIILLSRTVDDAERKGGSTYADCMVSQVDKLSTAFEVFESTSPSSTTSIEALMKILIRAQEFDVEKLRTYLDTAPIENLDLRNSLLSGVCKLGRYYQIACNLIDAARRNEDCLFNKVTIEPLMAPDTICAPTHDSIEGVYDRTVNRVLKSRGQLGFRPALDNGATRSKFEARLGRKVIRTVHAEVQLLVFYESHPEILRPRIICSSKSACYLCNLFFRVYGQIAVPGTHNKIYDLWTIPESYLSEPLNKLMIPLVQRLTAAVEGKIVQIIVSGQILYNNPNESVLTQHKPWDSVSTIQMNAVNRSVDNLTIISKVEKTDRLPMLQEESPRQHFTRQLLPGGHVEQDLGFRRDSLDVFAQLLGLELFVRWQDDAHDSRTSSKDIVQIRIVQNSSQEPSSSISKYASLGDLKIGQDKVVEAIQHNGKRQFFLRLEDKVICFEVVL